MATAFAEGPSLVPRETVQYIVLAGRPPIREFVRYVRRNAVDGQRTDEILLTQEWRIANERVRELERTEAGFADTPEPAALPPSLATLAEEALQDMIVRRGLSFLPYRWGIVELDRLVVVQKGIDLSFVEELKRRFGPAPNDEDVIRISTEVARIAPPVQVMQTDANTFTFSSSSNDLRILNMTPLPAENVHSPLAYERASMMLGIFVGYGLNVLQAFRMRSRTVLTNGTHRAYALRALGVTHVPCLIQTANSMDELELLGLADLRLNFERYFVAPRPPAFKDYFDERLRRPVTAPRRNMMLQVDVTIRQTMVPSSL